MKKRKKLIFGLIFFALFIAIILYFIFWLFNEKKQKIEFYTVGGQKENGLVISDNIEDENKGVQYSNLEEIKGNQFVWIPVENVIAESYEKAKEMIQENKYPMVVKDGDNYKSLIYYFNEKENKIILNEGTSETVTEPNIDDKEEQNRFNQMVEYIDKYKGFYVSRFEIGNVTELDSNRGKVISRCNQNHIADNSWQNMYNLCSEMYNYKNAKSEMIWGCQWNAILFWFNSNPDTQRYAFSLENKGNYSGKLCKTGSEEKYSINNIYDLFGNVAEWTQANSFGSYRVAKGASYNGISSNSIAVNDLIEDPLNSFKYIGTRAVLYIY